MLGKPRILSLFPNLFNKFNKTSTHVRSSISFSLAVKGVVQELSTYSTNSSVHVLVSHNSSAKRQKGFFKYPKNWHRS